MYIVRYLTCTSSKPLASPGLCAPRSPAICPGCKALLHSENFRAKVGNLRGWHLKLTVRPLKLDIPKRPWPQLPPKHPFFRGDVW